MIAIVAIGVALTIGLHTAADAATCEGPFKDRSKPAPERLEEILESHRQWFSDMFWFEKPTSPHHRADLCNANLSEAKLSGAALERANLDNANLFKADLSGAQLYEAYLQGANLTGANLQKAVLSGANLRSAHLIGADMTGAFLGRADLSHVVFSPKAGAFPEVEDMALARNLHEMRFVSTPVSLVRLREEFRRNGLRIPARAITFAIRHQQREDALDNAFDPESGASFGDRVADGADGLMNVVLFEWTSAYGMKPGRPLQILIGFLFAFSGLYAAAVFSRGRSGIWAIRLADRVHGAGGRSRPIRITVPPRRALQPEPSPLEKTALAPDGGEGHTAVEGDTGRKDAGKRRYRSRALLRAFSVGLYFSLLSAFQIGWRDFNVGNWISRIQSREYTLKGTGWVRTVAGVQALLSVYLVALWALTYFGAPFD
jgi:hypothetical protein